MKILFVFLTLCLATRFIFGLEIVKDLPVSYNQTKELAKSVCGYLFYDFGTQQRQVCQTNFLNRRNPESNETQKLEVKCQTANTVTVAVTPSKHMQLITLINRNMSVLEYINYRIVEPNKNYVTISTPHGYSSFWMTILDEVGVPSLWTKGPDVKPWKDIKEKLKNKTYDIDIKFSNDFNRNRFLSHANISWNSIDGSDSCFNVFNYCNKDRQGNLFEGKIAPYHERMISVKNLPLDDTCHIQVMGKFGTTKLTYKTPACYQLTGCIPLPELPWNITLDPSQDGDGGLWSVRVHWARPRFAPDSYNVTLFTSSVIKSRLMPGNRTEVVFKGVSGEGPYNVVVAAQTASGVRQNSEDDFFPTPKLVLNMTLHPSQEGDSGLWAVRVRWTTSRLAQSSYNVTLRTNRIIKSLLIPVNQTEVVFKGVRGEGPYNVTVAAQTADGVRQINKHDFFPKYTFRDSSSSLSLTIGAWSAACLVLVAVLGVVIYWRRRSLTQDLDLKDVFEKIPQDMNISSESCDDQWEVRPERLLLHEVIGEGAFGVVRRGTFAPSNKDVAVKMLKGFPSVDEIRSFRAEMELMKSVGAHAHVVSLLGCCSGRRPLIVAEYCSRGDLLSYLRCSWDMMVSRRNVKYHNNNKEGISYRNYILKSKPVDSKFVSNRLYDFEGACDTELTYRDLLSFCRQIAMGMEFLASNRVVHRDLAARNVLVTTDRTLKIADFGLSRDVYQENQYKQEGNGKLPVKWMALESLTHRIYTTQSDVWSFGVVMWEVVALGGAPYAGVGAARLPRLLLAGYRMPRPPNCTPALYDLMLSCWREGPRCRPTFAELHARLDELLCACAGHYLSLALPPDAPDTHSRPHRYMRMLIRGRRKRAKSYERPLAATTNHYTEQPAHAQNGFVLCS